MSNIIHDETYYQISGWMINRLKLKGVALNVYAIIYGHTQNSAGIFTGSRQYLADFIGVTRPTVDNALNLLLKNKYIEKFICVTNGITYVSYKADLSILQGIKNFDTPCKESLHNNIEHNIEKEENFIKESGSNESKVTPCIMASNANSSSRQEAKKGKESMSSTNTNMFVANNDKQVEQQKLDLGTDTYSDDKKVKKFVKPTVEEVKEYCKSKGYDINAEHFVDYYESNGWCVGRNKMKDWKAAVRTWVWNRKESMSNNNKPVVDGSGYTIL